MPDRSAGRRPLFLVLLPLAAAVLAVAALLRLHTGVLEVARGPQGPEVRPADERRAMLADGWCAVSRHSRQIVGKVEAPHAPGRPAGDGFYPVQRTDVRAPARVDSAQAWIVSCPAALRGELPAADSSPVAHTVEAAPPSVPEALRGFCVPPSASGARPPAGTREELSALELFRVETSTFQAPLRCVIRSREAWDRVVETGGVRPDSSAAPVDFAHAIVLLAAQGERSSTGYGIRFGRIHLSGDTAYAEVETSGLGDDEAGGAMLTSPAVAIRLVGAPTHVVFIETGR